MDVTANMVTAQQMSDWAMGDHGSTLSNSDQWCWAMVNAFGLGPYTYMGQPAGCPAVVLPGLSPGVPVPAQTFLDSLRQYQLQTNSTNAGPGGTVATPVNTGTPAGVGTVTHTLPPQGGTPGTAGTPGTVGAGVLGPTNCQICQQLQQQPLLLLVLVVAAYYLFID